MKPHIRRVKAPWVGWLWGVFAQRNARRPVVLALSLPVASRIWRKHS